MKGRPRHCLDTTVSALRKIMIERLDAALLDGVARHAIEAALEELETMGEELERQATLLARENERYAEFFEHAPDAYLITDVGGGVREANQAALELLRMPRETALGAPLCSFIAEDERAAFLARSAGPMPQEDTVSCRARVRPAEGAPVTVEFSVRAIPLKKRGAAGLCWRLRPL